MNKPPHLAPATVWGFCLLASAITALCYLYACTTRPHEPVQPLPFSHATHTAASGTAMDCLACHTAAHHGAAAGLPTAASCLDCHRHILADSPQLLPLHAAANPDHPAHTSEPLRWVRKAPLPPYINFHHRQHTAAGHTCADCHPNPDSQNAHSMSSCLNCHRQKALPTNCDRCHK